MKDPLFYLGEGNFTKRDKYCMNVAGQIKETLHYIPEDTNEFDYMLESINEFVKSLRKGDGPWRKRTAGQIIEDGYITGCTDCGLVFVTLARIKGFPTAYVETIEENSLRKIIKEQTGPIEGHVFAMCYDKRRHVWIPYNPGYGQTKKDGKLFLWLPEVPERKFIEIARGLDFSHLYTEGSTQPIELTTTRQMKALISKLYPL